MMLAELDASDAEPISAAYSRVEGFLSPVSCAAEIIEKLRIMELKDRLRELTEAASSAADKAERENALREYSEKYKELQKRLRSLSGK